MWNKIYLIALAVAGLVMLALTFLAYHQLQSNGFAPSVIAENFSYFNNYYNQFLWISSLILLILANVMLWISRRSWALWTTLLYFAVFTLLQGWWLGAMYFDYQKQNNLTQTAFSFGGFLSAVVCVAVAVGIFFDQFLILRMRDRIHGVPIGNKLIDENPPNELLNDEKLLIEEKTAE